MNVCRAIWLLEYVQVMLKQNSPCLSFLVPIYFLRTETDIRERHDAALNRLLTYPHPLLVSAIGEQRYREGTTRIFEGLQCKELNKQLFFQLLDIIILELFPELDKQD